MKNIFVLENRVWVAGFLNIIGLSFQLYSMISTQKGGISIMFCIFNLFIQLTYAQLGKKENNASLMWCMRAAFAIQFAIMAYALYLG